MTDWFGLVCFADKNIFSCHTADSKPVKQEVNGTAILPLLVFHDSTIKEYSNFLLTCTYHAVPISDNQNQL